MANEGEFPKVDGDIYYASETNKFAKAGEFLKIGSSAFVSSGTAIQEAGSILIPANTLSNPAHIKVNFKTEPGNDKTLNIIGISGVDGNAYTAAGSGIGTNFKFGECDIMVGDTISGCIFTKVFRVASYDIGAGGGGFMVWNGSRVPAIDTTKETVIFLNFKSAATEQYQSYSVQSFRGTL